MFRISVTTLEKFRRCQLALTTFDTEAALIETIKGIFLGNDKTKTGSAYHKIIEGEYKVDESGNVLAEDFVFTPKQAAPALTYRSEHPNMVHEIPVNKIYSVNGMNIKISGRVDGLEGVQVWDPKTKFRKVDLQEYMDSYQWRYYLDILELDIFYYSIFEVNGFENLPFNTPYHIPDAFFNEPQILQLLRYPNMQYDCLTLLREFLDYIEMRDFFHLLKTEPDPILSV